MKPDEIRQLIDDIMADPANVTFEQLSALCQEFTEAANQIDNQADQVRRLRVMNTDWRKRVNVAEHERDQLRAQVQQLQQDAEEDKRLIETYADELKGK